MGENEDRQLEIWQQFQRWEQEIKTIKKKTTMTKGHIIWGDSSVGQTLAVEGMTGVWIPWLHVRNQTQ